MNIMRFLRFPVSQLVLALVLSFAVLAVFTVMDLSTNPQFSSILTRILGSLLAAGVILLLGRAHQGKALDKIGISPRSALSQIMQGVLVGALMMGSVTGLMVLMGWYKVVDINFDLFALGHILILYLFAALFEELLFRGIIFQQLDNVFGSWLALIVSGALFGATHLGNPGATIWTTLALAISAGVGLGAAYLVTQNIWLAVGLHWAWNFLLAMFGFAVSGLEPYSLLTATINAPTLWSGGEFGIEVGLPTLIAAAFASVGMLWVAVRRKHISPPSWSRHKEGVK